MKGAIKGLKKNLSLDAKARRTYRKLQKHLNAMPVGYPRTFTGIEIRLLHQLFTLPEAEAALCLDHRFRPYEEIAERVDKDLLPAQKLSRLLDEMEEKGNIFAQYRNRKKYYALHPLLIGIFEMQFWHLNPALYLDLRNYIAQAFMAEYLTTEVPQMRVIPVQRSITPEHNIATYDEVRQIVDRAGNAIGITDCICKMSKDSMGEPCKVTDNREVCMFFRDFYNKAHHYDWLYGRKISKKEAFGILDQNEKDGLVLMPSSMQEPEFICSCCGCCCGILELVSTMPRRVDFVASNYYASVAPDSCNGCGMCVKRCHMDAVVFDTKAKKALSIKEKSCIGCGLCVPTCKPGAIKLKKKEKEFIPPQGYVELYDTILKNKKGLLGKYLTLGKALMGMRIK